MMKESIICDVSDVILCVVLISLCSVSILLIPGGVTMLGLGHALIPCSFCVLCLLRFSFLLRSFVGTADMMELHQK